MSEGWSRPVDIDVLADGGQRFDVRIPLREFSRLREQLASADGSVHVVADFSRHLGFAMADVAVEADLTLVCQRCLGAMHWPVESRTRVALVTDLAAADRAPEGVDPVVVEDGRTSVRDLAEEELLLALPLIATHESAADCGDVSTDATPQEPPDETNKPFAQLGELWKRDR